MQELAQSAGLWPIWIRLGIQDTRLRYRRSAIGVGWIFLNLAIMIGAIGFIYSNLFGQNLGTFIPRLTISLIAWSYLTNSIVEGGGAFIISEGYIKQISLPLYVYVFRAFVSISLNSLISLLAYVLIAIVYAVPLAIGTAWVVLGLILMTVISFLLTLIFAHINVRFRDAAHLAAVAMQVLFYVTPVIFPEDLLRQRQLSWVVDANPLYHLLEVVRHPLLFGEPAAFVSYLMVVSALAILAISGLVVIRFYRRQVVFLL